MSRTVKRAFKYRCYPTPQQATQLVRTFGCVRLVYNKALEEHIRVFRTEGRHLGLNEASARLTQWKRDPAFRFLAEVSSVPLQQALRHLRSAFTNFFSGGARRPSFKSRKKGKASAEYTRSAFTYRNDELTLAKMDAPLRVVWSRPLPSGATPSRVTVTRDAAGRWFVSLLCEDSVAALPPVAQRTGVDFGITALATLSTGEKVTNPRYGDRDRKRLAEAQRSLFRKRKGSANRAKARRRVARVHARIADRRRDFLHKLSTRLVRENQVVVIEDLGVGWSCAACGARHDRDVNAAQNILAAGPAERRNACGAAVRPQRRFFPAGER